MNVDGNEVEWVGVVVIDHPDPPAVATPTHEPSELPVIAITRRDWEFLFDQLRSTAAVTDYIHRIAGEAPAPLGDEVMRYYELAKADIDVAPRPTPSWVTGFGKHESHPRLPIAPATSDDTAGHALFRSILEDIAESEIDQPEERRLIVLALLDRYPVAERARLGRLLLDHLDTVLQAADGETVWRARRVVQDDGALHMAFAACSHFTEVHRDFFREWAILRHHDTGLALGAGQLLTTVAVMLTPRHRPGRLWDTSMLYLHGDLDLDEEALANNRRLFSDDDAEHD